MMNVNKRLDSLEKSSFPGIGHGDYTCVCVDANGVKYRASPTLALKHGLTIPNDLSALKGRGTAQKSDGLDYLYYILEDIDKSAKMD